MEAEQQEVKRLKFSKEEEEEDDEEDEQEVETPRPSHGTYLSKEAEAMIQEEEKVEYSKENEASTNATTEDQGKFAGLQLFVIGNLLFMMC